MSKRPPRPQGYPWLSPYFVVTDAEAAIAFYQKAFGFENAHGHTGSGGQDHACGDDVPRFHDYVRSGMSLNGVAP